ncbi:phosphomannose isomerase type II C-terminal cupin domain [Janibacter hoylei]|uniref:Mannose-6-phosphate isomerase n=1 Tax=Janibacter hoylei PVAS-1 TaxID=1210046 RepID=K1DXQ2_9MICO|nr:phosphomannose isomerase type II C-terminal cupin domain [Janibacter hoylei]EKA61174.1 mannose-6-phosphate isomerase [Janibacter hoylei PVAS-1]MCT1617851.1 phosphomannose isomerase type II C-terminal cupin domain [Janibacter hoylei]MCT2293828.1 phosphomannose isomerase type II C-terminal cupin domain [Janibacter hoylei]MCW4602040.1 phosphomannose isomerase type II C-terminal cupin domain [Janibacter hoylei]
MTNLPDPREAMFVSERPWGSFQQFTLNEPTTVKVITVNPGQRLSLQTHEHRAEFWQVLDGPIDVTVGDETWSAQPGEQVWIAQGQVHRMGNSGEQPCRVLEVGYGTFDEDDIVRLEDDYQR